MIRSIYERWVDFMEKVRGVSQPVTAWGFTHFLKKRWVNPLSQPQPILLLGRQREIWHMHKLRKPYILSAPPKMPTLLYKYHLCSRQRNWTCGQKWGWPDMGMGRHGNGQKEAEQMLGRKNKELNCTIHLLRTQRAALLKHIEHYLFPPNP